MASRSEVIIDLGAGQPDFPTPDHIKQAGHQAIEENYTRYTPQPGFDDLRKAVARKFTEENNLPVDPQQVVVSCGAKHSLFQIIKCLVEPGGEVIILSPYWYAYPIQVKLAGGVPVIVQTRGQQRFHPEMAAIRAAVSDATKAVIINSPCNPTGAVYGRELLGELADLALQRDLTLIADEVYERILFDGAQHVSIGSLGAEIAARTITVNSVSKTHCMTGWRIGYAAMPVELAEAVTTMQSYTTSGPCAIAQRAALAALTEDSSHVEEMVAQYARRREYLLERLARMGMLRCTPPEGTFYLFVDVSALLGRQIAGRRIHDGEDVAGMLLEEAGVGVIPTVGFGAEDHIRLSFAASMDVLEEGMDRIERAIT